LKPCRKDNFIETSEKWVKRFEMPHLSVIRLRQLTDDGDGSG